MKDLSTNAKIWSSIIIYEGVDHPLRITMQDDNNLVIYNSNSAVIWASGTNIPSYGNCYLEMRDDGNLVIIKSSGSIVWQTNTSTSINK